VIYLCAGIFAEGPTDHRFLSSLVERLLEFLGQEELQTKFNVATPINIGMPSRPKTTADEAILRFWDSCTLFIVHRDGEGDPLNAFQQYIEPSLTTVKQKYSEVIVVSCIPEREIEAWMLADSQVFSQLVTAWKPTLPQDPEKVLDPKQILEQILKTKGQRINEAYQFFGEYIDFEALRRLNSFQQFETELRLAIRALVGQS
jgi:hypothetical protein